MTKYYSVRFYPKSHTDAPSRACFGKIISQSKEDYENQLSAMIKGCEDWSVIEISEDVFFSLEQ